MIRRQTPRSRSAERVPRRRAFLPADVPADDVWQVARVQLRTWVQEGERKPRRPWLVAVVGAATGLVIGTEMSLKKPAPANVLKTLAKTMKRPAVGRPRRPSRVACADPELVEDLTAGLSELGIECVHAETPALLEALASLEGYLSEGSTLPALVGIPGATRDLVGRFFAAAAHYYRAAPWKLLDEEIPIAVRVPPISEETRYVVVMGVEELEYGLASFRSYEALSALFTDLSAEEAIARYDQEGLTYGPIHLIAFEDADAIAEHGWEVAGPEAYPMLIMTSRGELKQPTAADLAWYEHVLRAVPSFVDEHLAPALERGKGVEVDMAAGEENVQVSLRYPARAPQQPGRRRRK